MMAAAAPRGTGGRGGGLLQKRKVWFSGGSGKPPLPYHFPMDGFSERHCRRDGHWDKLAWCEAIFVHFKKGLGTGFEAPLGSSDHLRARPGWL